MFILNGYLETNKLVRSHPTNPISGLIFLYGLRKRYFLELLTGKVFVTFTVVSYQQGSD